MRAIQLAVAFGVLLAAGAQAQAGILYSNGFESDIAGWNAFGGSFNPTRVSSGTNGVTSATGSFHAQSSGGSSNASGSAGNWGGYNFGAGNVPTLFQEYTTSLDIFLNTGGGWANDTRFDYSSAINNASGSFLRDFVFNAGFYNDEMMGNRFVISASNNATRTSSFPKNPGRSPYTISATGWYTFEHRFYDNAGVLNVDLNILDSSNMLLNSWTLGTDLISGVGGNRYGWFVRNEFSTLAFDNTELRTPDAFAVPEATSLATFAIGACLMGFGAARRRRRENQEAATA